MGFLAGTEGVPDEADIGVVALGSGREPVVSSFLGWGDPLTDPTSAVGQLHFDVITSEAHVRTAIVTEHSVEQGAAIVDHVRPMPDRLTLEVFVSNTPINLSNDASLEPITLDIPQPGQGGLLSFLNGGTSALLDKGLQLIGLQRSYPTQLSGQVLQFSGESDYVQNTFNKLTELRNTATLLQVYTPRQYYSDMILESIEMHRDAGTGTSANFTLEFRQIRTVTSNIVAAPTPSIASAAPTASKGKQDARFWHELQSHAHVTKNGVLPSVPIPSNFSLVFNDIGSVSSTP